MTTTTIHATSNFGEEDLLACVPHLRAFAWFLARNRERADDLVQDTIVRALAAATQFQAGTNLKGWMFTILRNQHYNEVRKNRIQTQSLDDPLAYRTGRTCRTRLPAWSSAISAAPSGSSPTIGARL